MRLSLLFAVSLFVFTPLASSEALAQSYGEPIFDYAEVLQVDPIISAVQRPVYREECWDEPVTYREPPRHVRHQGPRAPSVMGGIVGGLIGNQFGHNSGRDAATAAGALLGYSMVRDAQDYGGYYEGGREYTRYERRCRPRTQHYRDEQVTGYNVTYRYQGHIYHTVTEYPPGQTIQVRVDVSAIP